MSTGLIGIHSKVLAVALGLGISAASGVLMYLHYQRVKRETMPKKWKKVGKLIELYFIPVKSCGAIELDEAQCENLSIYVDDIVDRTLMLIDDSDKLVSARGYPHMFKIMPKIVGRSKIVVSAPGMEDLEIDYSILRKEAKKTVRTLVHNIYVNVLDCGDKYHKWFSQFILGEPEGLRLVYYPYPEPVRDIDPSFRNEVFTKRDTGTLQDVCSYMLMNVSSVEDVNRRINGNIIPLQYRGSFVVKTDGPPYEEDHWQWVKIGDEAVFRNLAPCYRCIIPNIDPVTATRNSQNEPLKTLKTYRYVPNKKTPGPVMGTQMGLRMPGKVRKGDTVYVEDFSE